MIILKSRTNGTFRVDIQSIYIYDIVCKQKIIEKKLFILKLYLFIILIFKLYLVINNALS